MPANLKALSRYQIIDRCLSSRLKKYWTLKEINEELEDHDIHVCQRTLEQDLETLRHDTRLSFHAPIAYCSTHRGYHYTTDNYSIRFSRLTEAELDILHCGIEFVKGYEGIEEMAEFAKLIERVIAR